MDMPFYANCWIVALVLRVLHRGSEMYAISTHTFVKLRDGRVLHFTAKHESPVCQWLERWTGACVPYTQLYLWFLGRVSEMPPRKVSLLFRLAPPRKLI